MAWPAAAVAVGVMALVAPRLRGGLTPTVGDVATGWAFLGASCVVVRRRLDVATCLFAAGSLWIAVGLAPLWHGALASATLRLALFPSALLVIAMELAEPPRPPRLRRPLVVGVAVASAAAGAGGAQHWPMIAFGVCLLLGSAAPVAGAWVGAGFVAVGLCSGLDLTTAAFIANLHQLVLLLGAGAVAWRCLDADLAHEGDPVANALTTALGDALGLDVVAIAFPATTAGQAIDGWVDSTGARCTPASESGIVRAHDGTALAWLLPAPMASVDVPGLRDVLVVAGDVARLRAELLSRAEDTRRSTERLTTAAERECARLAVLLESGPIAGLHRVATLVPADGGRTLADRLDAAERAVRGITQGIDPIEPGAGITAVVQRLAARFGARCTVDVDPDLDHRVEPTMVRVVWFTCAEMLSNATKHAAGAPVSVSLRASISGLVLSVADSGGGGADITGSGLGRLAQRASELGASLTVDSPVGGGTSITLVAPSATCYPSMPNVPAPMPADARVGTMPS